MVMQRKRKDGKTMEVLTAKYELADGVLRITVSGEIDHHSARAVREEIDKQIYRSRAETVLLDLERVCFMDSSGLGLVLGRYTHAREAGAVLKVVNPSAGAERVLKMAGAEKIIPIIKEER